MFARRRSEEMFNCEEHGNFQVSETMLYDSVIVNVWRCTFEKHMKFYNTKDDLSMQIRKSFRSSEDPMMKCKI